MSEARGKIAFGAHPAGGTRFADLYAEPENW